MIPFSQGERHLIFLILFNPSAQNLKNELCSLPKYKSAIKNSINNSPPMKLKRKVNKKQSKNAFL